MTVASRVRGAIAARVHPPAPSITLAAPVAGHRFDGTTVLVTGGAGLLGRDVCRAFALEGARVIAVDVAADRLDALVGSPGAPAGSIVAITADLTDAAATERAVETMVGAGDQPNALVHCVGCNQRARFFDGADRDEWQRVFDVNLFGTAQLTALVLPHLRAAERASIVFVGSVNETAPSPFTAYAAAKAALLKLVEDLAVELAPDGVRVNAVAPGYISKDDPRPHAPHSPLHHVAVPPAAVTHAVLFLTDHAASAFTTGANIRIDAGASLEMARVREWRDAR